MKVVGPSLALRYATAADAPALFALGSDSEVTRFFSWGPYQSVEEPAAYIEGLEGERERGERLDFLIVDQVGRGGGGAGVGGEAGVGRVLGVTGLSEFSRRDRRAVVGTWLGRAYWGTGTNRASKGLIAWLAFEVLGLERLGAYSDLDNPRSQKALERIGFSREGVLRRWHRHGEHVHDVALYSWLAAEWVRSELADPGTRLVGEPPAPFVVSPAAAPS